MGREGQSKRSERIKQEILDTAMEIGIEEGFEALTVRKISDRMDYTTGVIYHHFKDKQEIIDEIQKNANLEMKERILAVLKPNGGFIENTTGVFHSIMELAINERERYNLIVLDKYSTNKNEENSQFLQLLEANIEKGIELGEIKKVDVKKTALCIWSSFLGFNLIMSKTKSITMEEAEELFNEILCKKTRIWGRGRLLGNGRTFAWYRFWDVSRWTLY